jgi:demethylmenaquinone methyltransferase / 2-methoxy-6-polyprenyl-1,4-benzoquinol methylase
VESAAASPRKRHALELFEGLPRRYDRTGAAMSFGQDPRWRRAMVDAVAPQPGQRILDVATGTGMVAFALAARGAQVTGLDQSEAMLGIARTRQDPAVDAAGGSVTLVTGEAEHLPFEDGAFDALTFTYLLRYVDDPAATLAELARVVKPGGRIGMVEFGVPDNPALRQLWRAHTRVGLPLMGRAVSTAWYEVGRFLGPNIEAFHAQYPNLVALWQGAGIQGVVARPMSFGAGLVMWGVRDGHGA